MIIKTVVCLSRVALSATLATLSVAKAGIQAWTPAFAGVTDRKEETK